MANPYQQLPQQGYNAPPYPPQNPQQPYGGPPGQQYNQPPPQYQQQTNAPYQAPPSYAPQQQQQPYPPNQASAPTAGTHVPAPSGEGQTAHYGEYSREDLEQMAQNQPVDFPAPSAPPAEAVMGERMEGEPIEIVPAQGVGMSAGCARSNHVCVYFFDVAFWGCIVAFIVGIILGTSWKMIPLYIAIGIFLLNLIISCCSSNASYLSDVRSPTEVQQHISEVIRQAPILGWRVQCYHYETRIRIVNYTDSDGNNQTRTETYTERVNTHYAQGQFAYNFWRDLSPPYPNLKVFTLTKVRFHKRYQFADAVSQQEYTRQMMLFKFIHDRDMYMDFHEDYDIFGYQERCLCECEPGARPAWMNTGCLYLTSAMGLGGCFHSKMESMTGKCEYPYVKEIAVQVAPPQPQVIVQNIVQNIIPVAPAGAAPPYVAPPGYGQPGYAQPPPY